MIAPAQLPAIPGVAARSSRRVFVASLGVVLISPPALRLQPPSSARGMLQVRVAPPTVARVAACVREVRVKVMVAGSPDDARYHAYGEIWEADEPEGDADFCCELIAQPILIAANRSLQFLLSGKALAAEIGVVKGVGPAQDETDSPDLVELFARIWLRDDATGETLGPWQSPWRSAVASTARDWSPNPKFPGSMLAPPRGRPPQACAPFRMLEPGVSVVRP